MLEDWENRRESAKKKEGVERPKDRRSRGRNSNAWHALVGQSGLVWFLSSLSIHSLPYYLYYSPAEIDK